jgi:uncharacterized protein (DUF1778 family)
VKKERRFTLRLTEEEYREWEKQANLGRQKVSAFVRDCVWSQCDLRNAIKVAIKNVLSK